MWFKNWYKTFLKHYQNYQKVTLIQLHLYWTSGYLPLPFQPFTFYPSIPPTGIKKHTYLNTLFFFFFFFLIVSYIKVRAVLLCIHAPSLFLWGPCFLVLVSFVVAAFAVNVLWYGHTGCVSTIHNLKLCRDIINFEAHRTGCIGINCVKRCCEAL